MTVSYLPSDISGSAIIADDSGFTDLISGTFVVGGIIFALVGVAMIWGGIVLFRFRRT